MIRGVDGRDGSMRVMGVKVNVRSVGGYWEETIDVKSDLRNLFFLFSLEKVNIFLF